MDDCPFCSKTIAERRARKDADSPGLAAQMNRRVNDQMIAAALRQRYGVGSAEDADQL